LHSAECDAESHRFCAASVHADLLGDRDDDY
jgi:hypothetical protein